MLLASKVITPHAVQRFVVDYGSWLDGQETLYTATVTVADTYPSTSPPLAGIGVETVTNVTISPSGQQLWIYANGNGAPAGDTFDVRITVVTVIGGATAQTKEDHVAFTVVAL